MHVLFVADFSDAEGLHDVIFTADFSLHNVTLVMDVSVCMTFRAATCISTIIDDALTQGDGMDWDDLNEKNGKAEKYRTQCTEGASKGASEGASAGGAA